MSIVTVGQSYLTSPVRLRPRWVVWVLLGLVCVHVKMCVVCVFSFPVARCVVWSMAVAVCDTFVTCTCHRVCTYYRYVYQLPRVDTVGVGQQGASRALVV